MTTRCFTKEISFESFQDKELNIINTERRARYEKTFFNRNTGNKFITDEVKIMRYKRNLLLSDFYQNFRDTKYTWIEIGVDFKTTTRIGDIVLKVKRNLKKIGLKPLSYFWLVDRGEINFNLHFHLILAVDKIDIKGHKLPNELKFSFKERSIHSSFVSNKKKMIDYLKRKPIFYIGKRKRVFGKSRFQYNSTATMPNTIQNKKSPNVKKELETTK